MCYSFQASIISYTLGMFSALFALSTNQIIIGFFILAYAQIQIAEAIIWKGIDNNDLKLNEFGTKIVRYSLPTHNIAFGLGVIFSIVLNKTKLKAIDFVPLGIGLVFYTWVVQTQYVNNNFPKVTFPRSHTTEKCQNPENRLQWTFPHDWYTESFIITIFLAHIWFTPNVSKFLFIILQFTMFNIIFFIFLFIYNILIIC